MLGFIGAGAMGGAIVRGVIESGLYPASEIFVCGSSPERSIQIATQLGVTSAPTATDLVDAVGDDGIVVIAVKPYAVGSVLDSVRESAIAHNTVIVSVAAGTTLETLASHLTPDQPIIRTMPNVNAAIGQSMTALCAGPAVSQAQFVAVEDVFHAVGEITRITEKDFSTFSALAGCSPAFTFEYIDAMARAGVRNGIPKAQAVKIAAQAVLGSAQMVLVGLEQGLTPASLADSVQSPGGTTVAGVVALEEAGFSAAVVRGIQASVDRDVQMQS
ncbi:pyrroline-5-carboxylate reductase [Changpingibacter yushuensis]|uniref:pyrroline-5-carboxylate reductase n=1 Tax=Changpingibacter yushuensis TaxID=2758440 RepID=UPI0015F39E01|nr:pyrroline-5-carboxylate reductase [Changpingibacter yushuensis]